jgi:hypothetical protein
VLGAGASDGRERLCRPGIDALCSPGHLGGHHRRIGQVGVLGEARVAGVLRGHAGAPQARRRVAAVEGAGKAHLELEFVDGVVESHQGGAGAGARRLGGRTGAR